MYLNNINADNKLRAKLKIRIGSVELNNDRGTIHIEYTGLIIRVETKVSDLLIKYLVSWSVPVESKT